MGLFYNMFIRELKKAYKESKFKTFESFLLSKNVKKIYKEFNVGEGSLHWALNVEKAFEELQEVPVKLKDKINEPLEANARDWANDPYLK
jgi:hypothetical protein